MKRQLGQRNDDRRAPDELFAILAEPRRRAVLRLLASADGSEAIDDLVDRLAAADGAIATDAVRAGLHHSHLPKLADAGFVEVGEQTVALTERGAKADAARRAANRAF